MKYLVLKFGGSSVGSPDMIRQTADIITKSAAEGYQPITVVSAFKDVTNSLITAAHYAAKGDDSYKSIYQEIEKRHLSVISELLLPRYRARVLAATQEVLTELSHALDALKCLRELSARSLDYIMSFGERLSASIIAEALSQTEDSMQGIFVDARTVLLTDNSFGCARVHEKESYELISKKLEELTTRGDGVTILPVVTGFISSTIDGATTTLGRGGSDYSGALFAAALDAQRLEIWTDVDGVLTADPRKVKKVFTIPQLSYEEALELSHFGAKVVYGPTMRPVLAKQIPIRICNTFNPETLGTIVSVEASKTDFPVTGLSTIDEVALLRVQGSGLAGVAGIASRLFGALGRAKINILLISQASSEHTICCAILPEEAATAVNIIEEEFRLELNAGYIDPVLVESELSILSVVGAHMRRTPGISARFFSALGRNGVNIIAIAQGSSELNISVVIDRNHNKKALNAVHDEFFQSTTTQSLNLFIVGTGLIGSTLLQQLENHTSALKRDYHLELSLLGVANSSKSIISREGMSFGHAANRLNDEGTPTTTNEFIDAMIATNVANAVFVDCTANESITDFYETILSSHISVVTPNKKAQSGPQDKYEQIKRAAKRSGARFLYETSVGAGLPVISTLGDLLRSGDQILKIEAVLSGTLSYIFNNFRGDKPFSEVVKTARQRGLTEPDPREDLSGTDVARKLLILAREAGFSLDLGDISVESLVPEDCANVQSVDEFFSALAAHDSVFATMRKRAETEGARLCYIAKFDSETREARVRLAQVDTMHPFHSLSGSDNIIAFTTNRYRECPLVVKGPGAGAEVTAAGILSDIVRIGQIVKTT
jgi:bifunctional aspartokinase / homoserine dehydrogenase 1